MGKPTLTAAQRQIVKMCEENGVHLVDHKGHKWPLTRHAIERLLERGDAHTPAEAKKVFERAYKAFQEGSKTLAPMSKNKSGQPIHAIYGDGHEFRLGTCVITTVIL